MRRLRITTGSEVTTRASAFPRCWETETGRVAGRDGETQLSLRRSVLTSSPASPAPEENGCLKCLDHTSRRAPGLLLSAHSLPYPAALRARSHLHFW
ncbi:hypothetical protein LEMLEM_LOCUS461 [Lemmus lemmus]